VVERSGAGLHSLLPSKAEGEVNPLAVSRLLDFARRGWREERGQTMAEYGVILAVVTAGIVVALTALSTGVQGAIQNIVQTLGG
jgi:Flp pilus assembly pilin Flp